MKKVLIGSAVRQDPRILEYFLDSLRDLRVSGFTVDYMFIDDNDDPAASQLLQNFRPLGSKIVTVQTGNSRKPYIRNESHHHWNEELIWRVARSKNTIINYCKRDKYDYLLLVDSDLVLHPETLLRLIRTGKEIVSEIFWTKWRPETIEMPQVWLQDQYTAYRCSRGEIITEEEKRRRIYEFLDTLRKPGLYRVGGLGACTLFSRKALKKGVSFSEIYNLSFTGEDRHLCIRAAALGFELFVDTHFPAYHIYRESDLEGVPEYIASYTETAVSAYSHLITSMLKETLENLESLDFRYRPDEKPYRKNFTRLGWKTFQTRRGRRRKLRSKSILRAEMVNATDFRLDDTLDKCEISVELNFRGSERGKRVEKGKKIRLALIAAGGWKIAHYEVSEEYDRCKAAPVITSVFNGYTRVVKPYPQKITLAMLVRNEAGRYLPAVLAHAAKYVDEAVILDDASTDETVKVCREVLKDIPAFIHSNPVPGFANEISLRKQLWELAVQSSPDWILCLDADEMFEDRVVTQIRSLVNQSHVDVYAFRLFDFWDMEHYREDEFWNAHLRYAPFLVRYQPEFPYQWHETPLHCGRFPKNITLLPTAVSDLRVKHFGWATEKDRVEKYNRYLQADPDGKYGSLEQYKSVLDPAPNLKRWREEEF
ncbi:MAG: glycosyltransferase [Bacillota bacterium]